MLPLTDPEGPTGDEVLSEDEALEAPEPPQLQPQPQPLSSQPALLRPGVVHRLDKGTTGAAGYTTRIACDLRCASDVVLEQRRMSKDLTAFPA